MTELEVTTFCGNCNGTGYEDSQFGGSTVCQLCYGLGRFVSGKVDITDLDDKLNDIMDKWNDILDKWNDVLDKWNDIFEQVTGG